MNSQQNTRLFESIVELLELPDFAYEKAKLRYEDIGGWFSREESQCKDNKPHIFPQGSFRLGTAIRPLDEKEEYDLDLVCKLQEAIAKGTHTQQELKALIGNEIEAYRMARSIKDPKEEKHRCWRLNYADVLSFHMDILPCIPADESKRKYVLELMKNAGEDELITGSASRLTVSITDDRHQGYNRICDDWDISNPEGYAQWFESRIRLAKQFLQERVKIFKAASIDALPIFMWRTPLQRCVQILKRHRDQMFKDDTNVKPISIIISTLAARAYSGEVDINVTMHSILSQMEQLVNKRAPRVPNPVNPEEDFADKWAMSGCSHLRLEDNFWKWLQQVQTDFRILESSDDITFIGSQGLQKLAIHLDEGSLAKKIGLISLPSVHVPKTHKITDSAKPWQAER